MEQQVGEVRCRIYSVPKQGNSAEQIEDASAWDCANGRFAVSDGASESIFAGEWAKILARAYVKSPPKEETFGEWLFSTQNRWVAEMVSKSVPWYVEEKLRDGSFATFMGLTFDKPDQDGVRQWSAMSVGDCCLFQIAHQQIKHSYPIESSKHFGTRPALIRSTPNSPIQPNWHTGTARYGDEILLMTDALAQWFLKLHEMGKKPWHDLGELTDSRFPRWTDMQRKSRQLNNDDVSLIHIEIIDPASAKQDS
jgi:hypothetical protein